MVGGPEAGALERTVRRLAREAASRGRPAAGALPGFDPAGTTWIVWVAPPEPEGDGTVDVLVAPVGAALVAEVSAAHGGARRAEQLESVGRFASAVAHDFNNLLAAIRVTAHTLAAAVDAPEHRADCRRIVEATERAARLTRGLLQFSGRVGLPRGAVDLRGLVEDLAAVLPAILGPDVDLALALPPGPRWVTAERDPVEQVVMNLVSNAKEAMPEGGRLRLAVEDLEVAPEAGGAWDLAPGAYHVLVVEDDGPGIPPADRDRVFEPYFTTKVRDGQRGLGLGLATVYGTARSLGGDVRIADGAEGGARFEVALPARRRSKTPVPRPDRPGTRRGGDAVLVVDDDALVRRTTADFLASLGYEVFEAESGVGALSVVAEHRDRLEAVLLDMIMPGMNGRSTCRAIRRMAPGVRVILMSGCSAPADTEAALDDGAECFLPKPFDLDDLAERLGPVSGRGGDT